MNGSSVSSWSSFPRVLYRQLHGPRVCAPQQCGPVESLQTANAEPLFDDGFLQIGFAFPLCFRHFMQPSVGSGRSVAWLARVVRVHEVVSSNLTAPTILQQRAQSNHAQGHSRLLAIRG